MTYEFHDDGTMTFALTERTIDVQMPSLKKLLAYKRAWQKIINANNRYGAQLAEQTADLDDSSPEALDLTEEMREHVYELIEQFAEWHLTVFNDGGHGVDEDELPAYFGNLSLPLRMIEHWQGNPKASGTTPDQ